MIRRISMLIALAICPVFVSAKTIYSGEFDYRQFKSSNSYFSGQSAAKVAHLCKSGEHASNEDLAQCSHRDFESAVARLNEKLRVAASLVERNDKLLKEEDENPLALPYFDKAESAWVQYRDSACYAETYMMGEAAERYINFWGCMKQYTDDRISAIDRMLKDWSLH